MFRNTCVVCGNGITTNNPQQDTHDECLTELMKELARKAVEHSTAYEQAERVDPKILQEQITI